MPNIFFASDHHFGHRNIIKFTGLDGELIRPGFESIEHMNETIIERHNKVVKPNDKFYCGGDFGDPEMARRMNGHKRLILGNHDQDIRRLSAAFEKIQLLRYWKDDGLNFLHTHFPVHMTADQVPARALHFNVHGHIHEKLVRHDDGSLDNRYINICVEHLNYTPIHYDELVAIMKNRMVA